ncbi:MAG: hypothetical protein ACXVPQ_11160, partial [Bacteroidia bacterium]
MKQLITFILLFGCGRVVPQSLAPSVLNSDGGTGAVPSSSGSVTIYYNIGEPLMDDIKNTSSGARLTQGFLQPEIVGYGVLQVSVHTGSMTCVSSNDASVVLNANGPNTPF